MNSKITKLKTSEVTRGFMGKLMLTYFILVVLNLIITYLLVDKLTYTASIVSTIISTFIFCVMTLGIKSIFEKSQNASIKELIPSLSFFLNSLGINVILSIVIGFFFAFLMIGIFVIFVLALSTTNVIDVLVSSIFILVLILAPIIIFLTNFLSNIMSLARYAVLCEDDTNLIEAISFGFKSVFGNFKYFLLLSLYFTGLMLLAVVTCGLSLIYTMPRTMCVQYQAYIELVANRNKKDEFGMF